VTDPRDLCVIGVAQVTTRPPGPAPEPLESWEHVARLAADDAGCPDALAALESVQVVYCQTWPYDDPVGRLCERLGASPRHRRYSGIGGTTPQDLVSATAEAMQRGELDLALVVGGEALATLRAAKRAGERLPWSHRETTRTPFPWEPPHQAELDHQVFQAWETFPLWDTARRAARGTGLDDYAQQTAQTMAALSSVSAGNPHAWAPVALTAAEVGTPGPANRYVGWPYPKREVAVMDVDMAAALLLATVEKADALGVPEDRRVHLASSCATADPASVAERADLSASAAMHVGGRAALAAAEVGLDELTHLELYSCFPSSLHLACDALGLDPGDPRGLTVTGGLPYAGGPGSGYLLHAIASTVDRLRRDGGAALVTGVGMHLAKHVAAVYRTTPGWSPVPEVQHQVEARQPRLPLLTAYAGTATVGAYTVAHDRTGEPVEGLVVLDTAAGRALARVRRPDLLRDAESRELVGQRVTVTTDGTANEARW
jgi:acetyl-CoA C-acetyltransferase